MEDVLGHPLQRDPAPYLTKAQNTIYTEQGTLRLLIPRNDVLYAKDYIELYLKERPKDIVGLRVQADIYRLLNKIDDALLVYQKIIELNTKDAQSYFDLGNAYFEAKNYYKASFSYNDAIVNSSEFQSAYYFALAQAYEKLGKIDLAKENFLVTQEFDPANEEARKKATYFIALNEFVELMQANKEAFKQCLIPTEIGKPKEPILKVIHASATSIPPNVQIFIKEIDTIDTKIKVCIDKVIDEFSYDYVSTVPVELEYSLDLINNISHEKA